MLQVKSTPRPDPGEIWLRVGAPIFVLVFVIILGALAIFWNLAKQQDRDFALESQRLVASNLAGAVRALANTEADFAYWNDAYRAVSLRWDQDWLETNFLSSVADGLVVFRPGEVPRYHWFAETGDANAEAIAASIARSAASSEELVQVASAPAEAHRAINHFAVADGRLTLISTSPVSWESEDMRLRHRSGTPVDYLATIDFLGPEELAHTGVALGLVDLAFTRGPLNDSQALVSLAVRDSGGNVLGALTWQNARPGTRGFAAQIGPILLGLILVGALAALIAHRLVARQVQMMAFAETALESSRLKSEFIATMSHELRTPLNAIIGYTELIQENLSDAGFKPEQVQIDLGYVHNAGQHLLKLINDILQHSRIDEEYAVISAEDVDVAQALAEAEDAVRPLASANGNEVQARAESEGMVVAADPKLLAQCLFNLAGNAAKFTRSGVIQLNARRVDQHGRTLIAFDVTDTGIGIARDDLARLFEPFQQANASIAREYGGAGLGLSITRKLARAMGGDVLVKSQIGVGSTFTLLLPVATPSRLRLAA